MPSSTCGVAEAAATADVAIAEKVCFLCDPRNYPGQERRIEIVETHFSWVFLTGEHAYKLKKPACGEGFDFRSVEARRRNAVAELRLNRRLASKTYLGLVALTHQPDGALKLDGDGVPVDWLVKMVRLDANRMLDRRLASGNWHYHDLEALGRRLAGFFGSARRAVLPLPRYLAQIKGELDRSLVTLSRVGEPELRSVAVPIVRGLNAFLVRRVSLFRQRVGKRLIDGHGDLRPEHVYLHGIPQIIDCLEFRPDLRRLDPINEIAFLVMECGRLRPAPVEERLMRRYMQRSGDKPSASLVSFYTALNAVIRARLALDHIAEPGSRTRAEWVDRAASYLAIAARTSRQLSQ